MKYLVFFLFLTTLSLPLGVQAAQKQTDQITARIIDVDGDISEPFFPFEESYRGAGSVASADLGADGIAELLIGSGPGLPPEILLLRQDGTEIGSFLAYDENMTRGINIATCDVDADGNIDIVTAPMFGGGPHVRVFDAWGKLRSEFFAYDESFLGGVNISCGDVDNDGNDDIITGAGMTGGPHVRVFDKDGEMLFETFTGDATDNTGTTVAAADLDGDGDAEILSGREGYGDPTVVVVDLTEDRLRFVLSLVAFDDYQHGIRVFSADIDDDGMDEIGATTQGGDRANIALYEMTGVQAFSYEDDIASSHGMIVAAIEGKRALFALTTEEKTQNEPGQYIRVDISEQTLRAYQDGALVYSALVSTGLHSYPTPIDRTVITDKLLWHDYVWSYGEDNPNNYALMDVKYNLRFRPHYYLHYAYWPNNFGNRMSHGCVNMAYDDVEWIYNWASVGATVEVVE